MFQDSTVPRFDGAKIRRCQDSTGAGEYPPWVAAVGGRNSFSVSRVVFGRAAFGRAFQAACLNPVLLIAGRFYPPLRNQG